MTSIETILRAILEDEDEEDFKEVIGPPGKDWKEGSVERHDRWADIRIGDDHWCISYLTPVAVFIHGQGPFITDKRWGVATSNHIRKWADEIGWGSGMSYREIEQRAKKMSQQELIERFKEESAMVKWTKQQARTAGRLPEIPYGLKSGHDERVEINPYTEPE